MRNPGLGERAVERVLDEIRGEKGLTQDELARAAGISRNLLSDVLAGNRSVTVSEFEAMCQRLGVTMKQVLDRAAEAPKRPAAGTGSQTGLASTAASILPWRRPASNPRSNTSWTGLECRAMQTMTDETTAAQSTK